jgi:hypothetical protein
LWKSVSGSLSANANWSVSAHGRKHALNPHQQAEALRMLAAGETQRGVARLLGVGQATIGRLATVANATEQA